MNNLLNYSIICFILILNYYTVKSIETRNSTILYNPLCDIPKCKNETSLVYVNATGDSDTLHIFYSSIGAFTIMLFKTNIDSVLNINWKNLLSNNETEMFKSIGFSIQPNQSAAFTIPKIYEFNDTKGTADLNKIPNNSSYWYVRNTADLKWNFNLDKSLATIGTFEATDKLNGTFKFVLRYFGKEQRDKELPHLLVSLDSTSIDFVIDSVPASFVDSKFAVNVICSNNLDNNKLKNTKSLDDEYTPGTFQQWTFEGADESSKIENYMQWKPIFYYYKTLTLENSTETKQYTLAYNKKLPLSLASAYFDSSQAKYSEFNVSFGIAGDEKDVYFYPQSNYSSWSFMVGVNAPATEKMSTVVTIVIFVGFGLPGLVILLGLFGLAIKKCKNSNRSDYETIQ